MRVVVCGRGAADTRSSVWAHVAGSLRAHGYEVLTFDPTMPSRSGLVRGDAVAALRALLVKQRPHLLVHVPTPGDLSPAEIRTITAASETVAVALHTGCRFPDAPTRCSDASDHLRDYDLVAVPDQWSAANLAVEGGYRLSCLEPAAHAPSLENAVHVKRSGVVVIGEPDDRSANIARSMIDADIDVRLFGEGWSHQPDLESHSFALVPYGELGSVLAGAALLVELPIPATTQSLLEISTWEAGLTQCVLDAACVSTPSLSLARPGVSAFLVPGESVFTYDSDDDVANLASMLLTDPTELQVVGEAAGDRVRASHRWTDRWIELLEPFVQPDDDGESVVVKPVPTAALA